MNCKEVENKLISLCGDSLALQEKEQMTQHLESCASCAYLHGKIRTAYQRLCEEKEADLNPYFTSKTVAKAQQGQSGMAGIGASARKGAYATALLVGLITGIMIGSLLYRDSNVSNSEELTTEFFNNDEPDV